MQHKTVKTKNHRGEDRAYTFKLLSARDGLEFYHSEDFASYGMVFRELLDSLDNGDDGESTAMALTFMFSDALDWEKTEAAFAKFLGGAIVDHGETDATTLGDDGICSYAQGDPLEQYMAFAHAFFANFRTCSPFFAGKLASAQKEIEKEEAAETEEDPILE